MGIVGNFAAASANQACALENSARRRLGQSLPTSLPNQ
jgi:hypothetical protein